ncbi:CLUMA_CG011430, isoform A [Clunio marinus]|uniref:CLUMA_CG011430, isoform A n=1 Tax=Clunio marinus TaxID=568069 RepID=A0A1J1ICQ3_9DIPT|nr:CLUMA_CG011430, isoform A [Clunio marinus]
MCVVKHQNSLCQQHQNENSSYIYNKTTLQLWLRRKIKEKEDFFQHSPGDVESSKNNNNNKPPYLLTTLKALVTL